MKILFTHDFLTTRDETGKNQLNSLSFIKKLVSKIDDVVLDTSCLSRQAFLHELGMHDSSEKYLLHVDEINIRSLYPFAQRLLRGYDLVVGYELTHVTRELLSVIGVRYLDIWVSPIRFYRDVFFEMGSNCDRINQWLCLHALPEERLWQAASDLVSYTNDFLQMPKVKANSLLVVSQLAEDKSVACNGRFMCLSDFQEEVFGMASKHDHTYFLKHPKASELSFIQSIRPFSVSPCFSALRGTSIYSLLASPNIITVAGISSSVMAEAKFFGKNYLYLFRPVIPDSYKHIYESAYSLGFWCGVLGLPRPKKDSKILFQDNDFRVSQNAIYGFFPYLNINPSSKRLEDQQKIFARLFDYIDQLNENNIPVTVYGYGSVGRLVVPLLKKVIAVFDRSIKQQSLIAGTTPLLPASMAASFKQTLCLVSAFQYFDEIISSELADFSSVVNLAEIIGLTER